MSAQNLEGTINEITILRKLDHPNIIKLYRVYENDSQVSLVLDYLEGGDLFSRIMEKSKLNESSVAKLTQNLLNTLEYLNTYNIAHRDIKLENIMMVSKNDDSNFKLVDFGLAHEVNESMTQRCGSPGYVAPEILRGFKYGAKVDTFSVGCVVYILLSGKMPFFGRDTKEVVRKNREGIICFRDRVWEHVSAEAINFIVKLMEPKPEERVDVHSALLHPWFRYQLRRNSNEDYMDWDEDFDISTSRGSSLK
ncbi:unnamed protein product [Blepharisma stoltei]|uniref:Protein kinase domain-containing protein n=1 Tax=Blepharisma stoltei TaxID=1481888 RepID=A0AAU9JVY1_9CILI|nr:unnamed protein product [Blepharisma stoltei]